MRYCSLCSGTPDIGWSALPDSIERPQEGRKQLARGFCALLAWGVGSMLASTSSAL